jgi:hypothetical protein
MSFLVSCVKFLNFAAYFLHCTALHCDVQNCTALKLHCTALLQGNCEAAAQCYAEANAAQSEWPQVQCSAVQCSAVQHSAVQCSTVQCSAVQCSAVQCSAVQCSAVQCSAVQCSADGPIYDSAPSIGGSLGGPSRQTDRLERHFSSRLPHRHSRFAVCCVSKTCSDITLQLPC